MNDPLEAGISLAVALLSRAIREDDSGTWELATEIAAGDHVREVLTQLASMCAQLTREVATDHGVTVGYILDEVAGAVVGLIGETDN